MTMLLAVDVGNSETKLGWFEAERLGGREHFATGSRAPADAVAALLAHLSAPPAAAAMCSGIPDAVAPWQEALTNACGPAPFVVAGDSDIGIINHYGDPATLGPDRLVGALAGRELYGSPIIVVSLGTATVVDAVSREGEYLGGAIAPGVETSAAALAERASRLLPTRPERAPRAIAADTRGGMIAGAFFGAVGQTRELLARVRAEMGEEVPAVLTGGWAEMMAPELDKVAGVEPALTLIGLRLAWQHAARGRR